MRDLVRPTTAIRGPDVIGSRQIVLLLACWVVWYLAASYALETVVSRLAPVPLPRPVP